MRFVYSIRYFLFALFSNTIFNGCFFEGSLLPNRKRDTIEGFVMAQLALIVNISSSCAVLLSASFSYECFSG